MCPRPEWAKDDPERWKAMQEARKMRLYGMCWYTRNLMDRGKSLREASEMLDHMMGNGYKPWDEPVFQEAYAELF